MLSTVALLYSASAVSLHCLQYNKNDCRDFELVKVPSDGIEKTMLIGNSSNLPVGLKDFHGLWYMNGNEMPDEVMSFGATTLNANEQDWSLKVYDERIWSFSPNLKGRALYQAARYNGFTYKIIKHNESAYQLKPEYHLPSYLFSLKVPLSPFIAKFMLIKTEDPDIWFSTGSWFRTRGSSYRLTRIVDGEGKRTVKYSTDYLPNIANPQDLKNVELRKNQLIAVLTGSEHIKEILAQDQLKSATLVQATATESELVQTTTAIPAPSSTGDKNNLMEDNSVDQTHESVAPPQKSVEPVEQPIVVMPF